MAWSYHQWGDSIVDGNSQKFDRTLLLLFVGIILFTMILFASEIWFMSDSQMFQVIAGVLTAFTGAFFGRIKPAAEVPTNVSATSSPGKSTATITTAPDGQENETK